MPGLAKNKKPQLPPLTTLKDVPFTEFTAQLISDTFGALVAANLDQTRSHLELVSAMSKDISSFVNETKDLIDGDEVTQLLVALMPHGSRAGLSKVVRGSTAKFSEEEASVLNAALALPEDEGGLAEEGKVVDNQPAKKGQGIGASFDAIVEAVARRIAANKYNLLTEMVRLGAMRLVVDEGVIETKLHFSTLESFVDDAQSTESKSRSFGGSFGASTGWALGKFVDASGKLGGRRLKVSTAARSSSSTREAEVDVMGSVRISFHTDYQPLSQR